MKKRFIMPLLALLGACSKIDIPEPPQIPKAATAEFSINKVNAYVGEPVAITPLDSNGLAANYKYDFGDGTKTSGKYKTTHSYAKSGNYKISLNADDKSYSKNIRILPGYMSYQISNVSGKTLDVLFYLDDYKNGTLLRDSLSAQQASDTLFAVFASATGNYLFHASVFYKNREYIIVSPAEDITFKEYAHTIFSIKDSTFITLRDASDSLHYIADLH